MTGNPFEIIEKQQFLITAGDEKHFNTMTAGWGGLGVLWGKPVVTVYIRPQRYTYEFMENSDIFTASFYPEEYREQISFCGSHSGRDVDKVSHCGFTPRTADNGGVYFEQAELVFSCKKIYYDDLKPENFLSDDIARWYNNDYHRLYVGEIQELLIKK